MGGQRRLPWLRFGVVLMIGVLAPLQARSAPSEKERLDGLNIITLPDYPFGSTGAKDSLATAKRLGAKAIAVVPFLSQPSPESPDLKRADDMTYVELRAAIREAHAFGFAVLVKPHVVVPDQWAGVVAMGSEADWEIWFSNYRRELAQIAAIAADEQADALAIGTELEKTTQRPEWNDLIAAIRSVYSGKLLYMAHNVDEAEKVQFWKRLDAIGVTLYPKLGADDDRDQRRRIMHAVADRLVALAAHAKKPIVVGEIGLRSARGAAARPWESVKEGNGAPDPKLQATVLEDWLAALDRPAISGVLIWCWFTNPDAGGLTDTDFTVQGKPTERMLMCAWKHDCADGEAGLLAR